MTREELTQFVADMTATLHSAPADQERGPSYGLSARHGPSTAAITMARRRSRRYGEPGEAARARAATTDGRGGARSRGVAVTGFGRAGAAGGSGITTG